MKSKFIKIISLILVLTLLIPTNLVYATTQGNGTGSSDNSDFGNSHESGREYASYSKTGWLVYVVDTSAKVVNNKVVYVNAGSNFPTGYNEDYLNPRFNSNIAAATSYKDKKGKTQVHKNAPWGYPFNEDGTGRGGIIRNEIIKNTVKYNNSYNTNMGYIIAHYLGDTIYTKVSANPNNYYLILEACAYHSAFNASGSNVGKTLASAYGWAALNKAMGLPKTGDGRNGWCDQYRLQRSCYLNRKWPGLPNPVTYIGPGTWRSGLDGISYDKLLKNYGYGMIAIRTDEGKNSTCDEKNTLPHKAPEECSGDYRIVKNYVTKTTYSNGTVEYTDDGCFSREKVIENIIIEDEEETTRDHYKLKSWKVTTSTNKSVKSVNNKQLVWSDNVPGTVKKSGTNTGEIDVNSLGGKTVYLLLEREEQAESDTQTTCDESLEEPHNAPDESEGIYQIVKNYVTVNSNNTYEDDGCYIKNSVTNEIVIEDETDTTGYNLTSWKVTDTTSEGIEAVQNISNGTEYSSTLTWENNIPGTVKKAGTTEKTVDLNTLAGKTVYVLLTRRQDVIDQLEGDFTISESSLTKKVRFSESDKTSKMLAHKFSWKSNKFTLESCNRHRYTCNGCATRTNTDGSTTTYCPGHTDYCSDFKFLDDTITISLTNSKVNTSTNILVSGWQSVVKNKSQSSISKYWHTFNRKLTAKSILSRKSWDYIGVLWRGDDKLTIAKWKNNESTNSLMNNIGFKVADKPQDLRKTESYIAKFSAKFGEDKSSTRELATKFGGSVAGANSGMRCTQTRNYSFVNSTALNINNIKVGVNVYSGQSEVNAPEANLQAGTVRAGTVKFYPYIQMKYDTYNTDYSSNYSQTAYVLGNYQRKITVNNFCSVNFNADDNNSLVVSSNQFSTHNRVQTNLNKLLNTSGCVYKIIPGGAVLSVMNKRDSNDKPISKQVEVTSYQCILEGNGKTQVNKTGSIEGDFTENTAKSNHTATVNDVTNTLKELKLEMYGNTDVSKEPFNSTNISKTKKFNNNDLSTDTKYNWNNFNSLSLDAEEGETVYTKYKFSTDVYGNILMNDTVILSKNQSIADLSNETAIDINKKTDVINQLVQGLERNGGDDETAIWAPDGTWYNEAFDGITVLVSKTAVNVGLWNPMELISVFDTKLTPKQTSNNDMGTQFYVFQMKTKSYSEKYTNDINRVGNFMGIKIYSSTDLDKLYKTDKWFTSNITTSDLK